MTIDGVVEYPLALGSRADTFVWVPCDAAEENYYYVCGRDDIPICKAHGKLLHVGNVHCYDLEREAVPETAIR